MYVAIRFDNRKDRVVRDFDFQLLLCCLNIRDTILIQIGDGAVE